MKTWISGLFLLCFCTVASGSPINSSPSTVAGTATALVANGANCGAGNYPLGVDSSGAVESCTSAEVSSNTITGVLPAAKGGTGNATGLAATATALAANGANCSAGNYPLGVDASGAAESCTSAVATSSTSISATLVGQTFTATGTAPCVAGSTLTLTLSATGNITFWFVGNLTNSGISQISRLSVLRDGAYVSGWTKNSIQNVQAVSTGDAYGGNVSFMHMEVGLTAATYTYCLVGTVDGGTGKLVDTALFGLKAN